MKQEAKQKSKWLIFALLAVAQFMVVLDVSIVNVALPSIKAALGFSNSSLQWIITAYALAFGGFLLLGGRAADLFGRRKMVLTGMIGFTLFSLLIGLAQSSIMMIVLRALQGLAAAFMSPAALSIVLTTFKEGVERNRALGLWSTIATGGAAAGLLLGGVLTQYLSWHWDFFVNVPIGVLVAWGIYKIVPVHAREERDSSLDLPGAVLVTSGLIALVYALGEAPKWGWLSAATLGTIGGSLALIAAFIWNEARAKHPLMPLSIFKIRNVTGANLMMAPIIAGMMGMFFLLSLYITNVMQFSPVIVGLAFLPFPVTLAIVATQVAKRVGKVGFKPFLVAGPLLVALGLAWLARLPIDSNYFTDLLPSLLLIPVGMGMAFMPLMVAATSGVPAHEAGLASGLINTSQQMGGAVGLAALSGIAASVTSSATNLTPLAAMVHGYNRAFLAGVVFMIFAIVLGITVIRQPKRQSGAEHSGKLTQGEASVH
jgi:EmrB/QacA subfamily drug resistance transporter